MKKLILLSVMFLFFYFNAQAQLKLGVGGGFSFIQSPDALTNQNGLDFNNEYHIGVKAKLSLPLLPFAPAGFINYHMLNGEGSSVAGNFESKSNIISLGLGGEMSLIPGPVSPYLSLDIAMNIINDIEVNFNNTNSTISLPGSNAYSDQSRFGLGLGAGAEITLLPINFDLQLKYNFINLIGKKSGEESIGILTLTAYVLFSSN
ncbi:MAG TPA: outer membrane beta-barrel protein [Ignavibacteriaceae bacterium]|nr:outer membrane beta-barrel protein [Ignavibacteriaceae bacterium]